MTWVGMDVALTVGNAIGEIFLTEKASRVAYLQYVRCCKPALFTSAIPSGITS